MAKLLKHLAVVQRVLCEFNRRISPAKIVWDQVFRDQNIRRVSKLNYLAKPFPVLLRVHRTAIPQKQRVDAIPQTWDGRFSRKRQGLERRKGSIVPTWAVCHYSGCLFPIVLFGHVCD